MCLSGYVLVLQPFWSELVPWDLVPWDCPMDILSYRELEVVGLTTAGSSSAPVPTVDMSHRASTKQEGEPYAQVWRDAIVFVRGKASSRTF